MATLPLGAQSTAPGGASIDGVPKRELLQRLGARMERGLTFEQRELYQRQFQRVDTNDDGRHSRAEYVEGGRYLTPQARRGIFRAADRDRDDVVSWEEYLRNRVITDEAKSMVQAMDDNEDGAVQQDEWLRHAPSEQLDKALALKVFAALDTNRNGEIIVPEYLRVWGDWARSERRPNIIVIMADDLGYADTSVYDGWVETPQLERLAREGMRFTDFHTNSSVCSPTRAAFLTGRYQQRVGIVDVVATHLDTPGLDPSQRTLSRVLKEVGYHTGLQGKWHLGREARFNPVHHGFDEFRGYLSGYIDYHDHRQNWLNGLEVEDQEGYVTHLITANAVRFIEAHQEAPFFLLVSHEAVHLPYQTPEDTLENRKPIPEGERWNRERIRPKYKVMLEEMDRGVGEILDALERCQLEQDTLVFFFSDNGATGSGSNKPWRGGKFSHYEGGHRVPAIAWWPGKVPAGVDSTATVMAMDLFPTVVELLDIPLPQEKPLDGVSLTKVLQEEAPLPERELYFGYEPKLGTAMRDGKWKMIAKEDRVQLYDLSIDPGERNNVVEAHAERAGRMRASIEAWKKEVVPGS